MRVRSLVGLVLTMWAAAPLPSRAQVAGGGETVITADSLQFDYQKRICVFEGNVVAQDPSVRLESQKLHIFFDADNRVESVVATGQVRVTQGDRIATCGKAVYTVANGAIVMTEKPVLARGGAGYKDKLEGTEIRIFVHTEQVISLPARLTVFPGNYSGAPGAKPAAPDRR